MCTHEFKTYVGFSDSFEYCSKCNKKRSEITEAPHVFSGDSVTKAFKDAYKDYDWSSFKGLSAWLPDTGEQVITFGTDRTPVSHPERLTAAPIYSPYNWQRRYGTEIQYSVDGNTWTSSTAPEQESYAGEASHQVVCVDRQKGLITLALDDISCHKHFEVGMLIDTTLAVFDDEEGDEE